MYKHVTEYYVSGIIMQGGAKGTHTEEPIREKNLRSECTKDIFIWKRLYILRAIQKQKIHETVRESPDSPSIQ